MRSSKAAVDLIIACEVGNRQQYDHAYCRPTWPGGRSGVTVAIGYDLGYVAPDKVQRDFGGIIPQAMVIAMQNVCGLTGQAAHNALQSLHSKVMIPWSVAVEVFENVDLPRYEHLLFKACPRATELPSDCIGALTSVVYNRGDGGFTASGDRFREMRAIKAHIESGEFDKVPDQIRSMKRLWGQDQRGLRVRRDKEADLYSRGLVNQTGALPPFLSRDRVTPGGNTPDTLGAKPPYSPVVETMQRNLASIGYHEVGDIDGRFGGKTRAAVTAFMTDRGQDPQNGAITQAVIDEVGAAVEEGWQRPISEKRANTTAKDLSGKVASVDHTWWQKLWAFVLGIPSAAGAIFKSMFGDQSSISDYVDPVRNFFAGIPPEFYFVVAAGIALAIFIQAKRTQDATVRAYRRGEIN